MSSSCVHPTALHASVKRGPIRHRHACWRGHGSVGNALRSRSIDLVCPLCCGGAQYGAARNGVPNGKRTVVPCRARGQVRVERRVACCGLGSTPGVRRDAWRRGVAHARGPPFSAARPREAGMRQGRLVRAPPYCGPARRARVHGREARPSGYTLPGEQGPRGTQARSRLLTEGQRPNTRPERGARKTAATPGERPKGRMVRAKRTRGRRGEGGGRTGRPGAGAPRARGPLQELERARPRGAEMRKLTPSAGRRARCAPSRWW